MNYATWGDRVIAALIDTAIVVGVLIVLSLIFGGAFAGLGGLAGLTDAANNPEAANVIGGLGCMACFTALLGPLIVYFVIGLWNKVWLPAKRGYSIGQGVMKLRVVTPEGGLVPLGTLVLRLLITVAFGFIPFVPLLDILWPLWDERRQTLHDKAVNTYVVKVGV
jgi:uncharacterized RDD family membrane protein YckC